MLCIPVELQEVSALSEGFQEVFCAWKSCKEQLDLEGKRDFLLGCSVKRCWRQRRGFGVCRAAAMGDWNKEDAEGAQMQKENKGKKVVGTKGVKRAQKIRSGAEGGRVSMLQFLSDKDRDQFKTLPEQT